MKKNIYFFIMLYIISLILAVYLLDNSYHETLKNYFLRDEIENYKKIIEENEVLKDRIKELENNTSSTTKYKIMIGGVICFVSYWIFTSYFGGSTPVNVAMFDALSTQMDETAKNVVTSIDKTHVTCSQQQAQIIHSDIHNQLKDVYANICSFINHEVTSKLTSLVDYRVDDSAKRINADDFNKNNLKFS